MSTQSAESRKTATASPEVAVQFVCTVDELAEVFEVSTRTINRMAKAGMPRLRHGTYDLRACFQWQAERLRVDPVSGEPNPRDLLTAAQITKITLETKQVRAGLIPATLARQAFERMAEIIGTELEAVADVADELAASDDPSQVQARLFQRSRVARRAIAARMRELAANVESGAAFRD